MTTMARAEEDFERLYRGHHREILAYCARRLPASEAFDAAAETFVVAWRRFDQVPEGERTLLWLYGVAHRTVRNQWRSRRRWRRLSGKAAGLGELARAGPEQQTLTREEHREVVDALLRLRNRDREILLLAVWEELKPEAIAEVLGISRSAVDQRFARAKRRLADELTQSARSPWNIALGKGELDA